MTKRCLLLGLVSFWLAAAVPPSVCRAEEEEAEEGEEQVTADELPAAVKKTLDKAAQGGKVREIERETEGGKTVYEAEVVIKGKTYEIEIAENGTLIGKSLDDEDDDEGEDDDDDDGDGDAEEEDDDDDDDDDK
jgi:hypothetical protein